jgi:hypothetical protein
VSGAELPAVGARHTVNSLFTSDGLDINTWQVNFCQEESFTIWLAERFFIGDSSVYGELLNTTPITTYKSGWTDFMLKAL